MWGWAQGKVFLVVVEVNEVTEGMRTAHGQGKYKDMKWVEEKKPEKKLLELGREPWETITGQGGKRFPRYTCVVLGTKAQFFHHFLVFFLSTHIVLNFSMEIFFFYLPQALCFLSQ